MSVERSGIPRSSFCFDAVLFDLDGVVTSTAATHEAAWRATFDQLLEALPSAYGGTRRPFSSYDYRRCVDGKNRMDGVRDFLRSRRIKLPEGDTGDPPGRFTVAGLASRKNDLFLERLAAGGATVFPDSEALIRELRACGVLTAVVSASRNCTAVLRAAGIQDLFDAQVDGEVAASDGLRGKPAPDTFLDAAHRLGAPPARAVVIEDATAGVAAARAGGFGLIIGVGRSGDGRALLAKGAHIVVRDLGELGPPGGGGKIV